MSTQLYSRIYNGRHETSNATHKTRVTLEEISPSEARFLLEKHLYERQRPIKKKHVEFLAEQMMQGRFDPGTQITFAKQNGKLVLLDGQHRLHAVVSSGIPQTFSVLIRDIEDDESVANAYGHLDKHAKRTVRDTLHALYMEGETGLTFTQQRIVASAASWIHNNFNRTAMKTLSPEDLRESILSYQGAAGCFFESIAGCSKEIYPALTRAATAAVALITFEQSSVEYGLQKVDDFWNGLAIDNGLMLGDPRKVANRHLLSTRMTGGGNSGKTGVVQPEYGSRYIANCWNAWVEIREIRYTKVSSLSSPILILGSTFNGK